MDIRFLKNLLLGQNLISATFTNTERPRIEKVILRPVLIKNKRQMQISYLDGRRDITKNFFGRQIQQKIGEVLHMEFKTIEMVTTEEEMTIEISDKGKVKIVKKRNVHQELRLSHDKEKKRVLDPQKKYDFLVTIGLQNQDGTINAEHRKKFAQINEFLKVIKETIDVKTLPKEVIIYDFGCGNAYITFALHYYITEVLRHDAKTFGIDEQKALVDRNNERAKSLGWKSLQFIDSSIKDYTMLEKPTIVLSLHACDTATDESLSQAITHDAQYIFAVPCCHKYMQQNLPKQKFPQTLKQISSHGILLQRTCDIVTDTFRALILRMKGYKTDVFEFVDSTHSAKNLMIRGVKLPHKVDEKRYVREYEDLKKFWGVSPYLEKSISL